ncbi:GGDEF domain-containing protein [Neptuniibacter sp. 1_MG-2023]|uniref:GGDEF domain-containing protein n=1 Tax=Neptuniibacter sp. 1_MG-2023 TaxID=3062662 RepID=UPI0026E35C6C|nr:GGDEF domain-containing protein [Neptuniibacter sp. 1_MG-2023]MDO6594902.1 GGDEF domain-containing protein [Neptuniibacter sp. 1_MG-2023]
MKKPRTLKLTIFVIFCLISLIGVNWWGFALNKHASQDWLEAAKLETYQATNTSLSWMSLFYSQLRGMATLFYGSELITEEEFFKGIDLLKGIEAESITPLAGMAYVSVINSDTPSMEVAVRYSTDTDGLFSKDINLMTYPAIATAVQQVLAKPSQVVLSPIFITDQGARSVVLAFSIENNRDSGVLLSLINLSDLFADLKVLHVSNGLRLRIVDDRSQNMDTPFAEHLMIGALKAPNSVETFHYQMRTGNADWGFYWDVEEGYKGGVNNILGLVVHIGGSALVLSLFSIIGALARQNNIVSHQVQVRTRELAEALLALEKSNGELRELANRDSLTNAYNRRCFMEIAESACAMSRRYNLPLTIIMLDVDYFKRVNDSCGHAFGDSVLLEIVNACNGELREVDSLGRIGGEEFAILLPETSMDAAYLVAERLRRKVAELRFEYNGEFFGVTVSIGKAHFYPDQDDVLSTLLKRADDALYEAKNRGRNQVVTYSHDTDLTPLDR